MKRSKRWMAALLAIAASAALTLFPGLAAPAETNFADFRIGASNRDVLDYTIPVEQYRRNDAGVCQPSGRTEYACRLNRVTGDASFYVQPKAESVRVTVDYLTDLNGDGVYELLDGGDSPVWDNMDTQGNLTQAASPEQNYLLSGGQTYILSAELLADRYQQAVQRNTQALKLERAARQEFPLCAVTLHHTDPAGEQTQVFYLRIYGSALVPFDIFPSDWYYGSVEFCLAQGYLEGMSQGSFGPEAPLNRAQLAKVLWTIAGSPDAKATGFSDVKPGDWFYQAVCWCQQEELIVGYSASTFAPNAPLTREQMTSVFYRYARYANASLRATANLSRYSDRPEISTWAYDSVRWALTNRLITVSGDSLYPQQTVSRAELAEALYAYDLNLGLRSNS